MAVGFGEILIHTAFYPLVADMGPLLMTEYMNRGIDGFPEYFHYHRHKTFLSCTSDESSLFHIRIEDFC